MGKIIHNAGSRLQLSRRVKISVIFTTYNSPRWLEKVLWGFANQTDSDFEVIVADDGSGPERSLRLQAPRASLGCVMCGTKITAFKNAKS